MLFLLYIVQYIICIKLYYNYLDAPAYLSYIKDKERIIKQINREIIKAPPFISLGYIISPFTCNLLKATYYS
jgi:hypothetical protein